MAPREVKYDIIDPPSDAIKTPLKSFTSEYVKNHPDLLIVGDEVYSAKRFQNHHPGGAIFVSMFGGRDGTEAFMEYHSRAFPKERMKEYLEGQLDASEKPMKMDEDYLKLSKQVLKIVPNRGFAPTHYWAKCALILGLTVGTEVYMYFVERTLLLSIFLGWMFALVGLNIQHDANHGTLSRDGNVNWAFGLFQDWIGGSSILWLQEHVVAHHLFTNDTKKDPDMCAAAPAIRINPNEPHMPWYRFQHLYIIPGEMAFGFKILFLDFVELVRYQWLGDKISSLADYHYLPSVALKIIFYLRFIVLPLRKDPTLHTVICIMSTVMMGSFYLAFFFALSHNFEGAGIVGEGGDISPDDSFMKRQVETSSNVGGKMLAHLNGGLNYQIEHHLFPRIHHDYYYLIAPTVRAFCEKKGLRYRHYDTIYENFAGMIRRLYKLGRPDGTFSYTHMYHAIANLVLDKHD